MRLTTAILVGGVLHCALCTSLALAQQPPQVWTNWPNQQSGTYLTYTYPESEEEIIAVINQAVANGEKVSVVGAGHSFNRAVPIDVPQSGHMIDLRNYNKLVRIEDDLFTFEAGIEVRDMLEILDAHGRTIPNHSGILSQSIAGVANTNTHGTGDTQGQSAFAVAVRVITSNGTVIEANADDEPELLAACLPGAGVIGVWSTMTIRSVPQFHVRHNGTEIISVLEFIERLPSLHLNYPRFQFYWNARDNGRLDIYEVTADPIFPEGVGCSEGRPCVDVAYKVYGSPGFNSDNPRDEPLYNAESFVPVKYEAEYIRRWYDLLEEISQEIPFSDLNPTHGIRFVKPDYGLISPMYYQDSVSFDIAWDARNDEHTEYYLQRFSELGFEYGARFHWGKQSRYTPQQHREVYPAWERFQVQRRRVDPTDTFLKNSDFIAKFGGASESGVSIS